MRKMTLGLLVLLVSACSQIGAPITGSGNEILIGTMRDKGFWGDLFGHPRYVYLLSTDKSRWRNQEAPWTSLNKPIWSPDGQWVAYDQRYSFSEEGSNIFIALADGSQPQQVTFQNNSDYFPSWSPDGKQIAYESKNTEHSKYSESGIYTLDVSCIMEGNPCSFNPTFIIKGETPDWSPDGKLIAFEMKCEQEHQYCINVIRADGKGESLQLSPSHLSCYRPQWSPDGSEIIFFCYSQTCTRKSLDEKGIYKAKSDGTEYEMIADVSISDLPQWSPNGSKIAFISSHSEDLGRMIGWEAGYTSAVFIMNVDGTGITRINSRNDEDVLWFTWSPFSLRD